MNIPEIEANLDLRLRDISIRFFEVRESYADAKAAEDDHPDLKAYGEADIRQFYAEQYPNVNAAGHWLIRSWHGLVFHYETARYIVTGATCRAWEDEMAREADDRLLSYAR